MIEIKIDVSSIEKIAARIDRAVNQAMQLATQKVAADAKVKAPLQTGQLRSSIQADRVTGSFASNTLEGVVSAGAPYARYVNEGTGIWAGRSPYVIKPKNRGPKAALRFSGDFGFAFAKKVLHRGIEPQPFLTPELHKHTVQQIFADAIQNEFD